MKRVEAQYNLEAGGNALWSVTSLDDVVRKQRLGYLGVKIFFRCRVL